MRDKSLRQECFLTSRNRVSLGVLSGSPGGISFASQLVRLPEVFAVAKPRTERLNRSQNYFDGVDGSRFPVSIAQAFSKGRQGCGHRTRRNQRIDIAHRVASGLS